MPSNRRALGEIDPNVGRPAYEATPPKKKRRGPPITPAKEKKYIPSAPRKVVKRTYTDTAKREVLMFLEHHRVVVRPGQKQRIRGGEERLDGPYRRPTYDEASAWFKIPYRTIADWYYDRAEIFNPSIRQPIFRPDWPDLEARLYTLFLQQRGLSKIVTTGWFRRTAREIFPILYEEGIISNLFTFSPGWFRGFLNRWNISRRRVTKQSSKLPDEYIAIVNNFLRFCRRINQPALARGQLAPGATRRFTNDRIINLDETPIPFEYLDGSTWATAGSRTVAGHTDRSGWSKRQATLILYIFADGIQRIKPKIIFSGTPTNQGGRIWATEGHLYSPDVTVEYNSTAYNNEILFGKWIDTEWRDLVAQSGSEHLLVMDVASFHKTAHIAGLLKSNQTTPCLIPPGTTSLLQPLDTAVNKSIKQQLAEASEQYVLREEAAARRAGETLVWTVSKKRVMVTWTVATAVRWLAHERAEMVQKAFIECGISVAPDGSEIPKIRIKDIPAESIDYSGWEKFDYDGYIKKEVVNEEISEAYVAADIDEYIDGAEDVPGRIWGTVAAPIPITESYTPFSLSRRIPPPPPATLARSQVVYPTYANACHTA